MAVPSVMARHDTTGCGASSATLMTGGADIPEIFRPFFAPSGETRWVTYPVFDNPRATNTGTADLASGLATNLEPDATATNWNFARSQARS